MLRSEEFLHTLKARIHALSFQVTHRRAITNFTRDRKLPFEVVFVMILKLVKRTLGIECELLEDDPSRLPPSKQAFSKARYNIKHTGFQELLELSLQQAYEDDPNYGTWKGYRLIAVDGSSLQLPLSDEIVEHFGRFKPNATMGETTPMARVSLFVDLCTSMICSARLGRWDVGERALASDQLTEVVGKMKDFQQDKLLFIYDRGYSSFDLMKQHAALGADFLFRLPRSCYKKAWELVDAGETDFDIDIQNKDKTEQLKVRVVAFPLKTGQIEVLMTSLHDRCLFQLTDLAKAYNLRWHIEECYKRLKVPAELENFSGAGLEVVLQEFWAHLLMCNVLSIFMCNEQGPWNLDKIPQKRLNFSFLFGVMRSRLQQVIVGNCSAKAFQTFFQRAAARAYVKTRPGRSFSREKVGKPRRHHPYRRIC